MKIYIIFLLLCGILFADVGPSPAPPSIVVNVKNNGQAYTGQISLSYACDLPSNENDGSPIDERGIQFECSAGTCTNRGWFYKLNPCFSGEEGHFAYEFEGNKKKTANIVFESETQYEFSLDLGTGEFTKISEHKPPPLFTCPLAILLLGATIIGVNRS